MVSVRDARLRTVLARIRGVWPQALGLDELDVDADAGLRKALLELHELGVLRLSLSKPVCVASVSERPVASAYARACARLGRPIASQYHEQVPLRPEHRELLQLLDGQRDQAALLAALPGRSGDELSQLLQDLANNALLIA